MNLIFGEKWLEVRHLLVAFPVLKCAILWGQHLRNESINLAEKPVLRNCYEMILSQ
jgi:hypothetical protein